jgi:hypothetical protein
MSATILYEDTFGAVIDYPDDDYLEIRWYDATESLDGDAFNQWLDTFTSHVERTRRSAILVDAVQFACRWRRWTSPGATPTSSPGTTRPASNDSLS